MAQFCVNIADDDVDRVINAMCSNYGYQPNVANPDFDPNAETGPDNPEYITNPETSFQFANRMTRDYLMNNTVAHEAKQAREALSQPSPPDISDPQE